MSSTEAELHEGETEFFISRAPSEISFVRLGTEADGAGGERKTDAETLPPQWVRVVGLRSPVPRVTPDGRTVQATKAIVGLPDLDVALEDRFGFQDQTFEVVNVVTEPRWRVLAEAMSVG